MTIQITLSSDFMENEATVSNKFFQQTQSSIINSLMFFSFFCCYLKYLDYKPPKSYTSHALETVLK